MTLTNLAKAPMPWFGGKSQAAPLVWRLLGDVPHYVEPFAGALGVLLNRPHPCNRPYYSESINDLDAFICNAWRAIQWHPDAVAEAASWPVSEADKTARQIAVLRWRTDKVLDLLAGDAAWCDPKMAGWWLWGVCVQIGGIGGPWTADPVTGRIVKQSREPGVTRDLPHLSNDGRGVNRPGTREPGVTRDLPHLSNNGRGVNHAGTREPGVKCNIPHLSDNGQGVNRPGTREPGVTRDRPHLSNDGMGVNRPGTREPGVKRDRPHLSNNGQGVNRPGTREPGVKRGLPHLSDDGRGVNRPGTREPGVRRNRPHLTGNGQGVNRPGTREPGVFSDAADSEFHPWTMPELRRWMLYLAARLRHVRILNGDWARLVTPGAAWNLPVRQGKGPAGVFLDPPYALHERSAGLYAQDAADVAARCREWCLSIDPEEPKWRIVLAGFDTEHTALEARGWTVHEWFTTGHLTGGYGNLDGTSQQHRERLWASPQCLDPSRPAVFQPDLFALPSV
jgi:hypothetical protein